MELSVTNPSHPFYVQREVVGRFLVSNFSGIQYRKLVNEEGGLSLRIWFNHWHMTSIIFTFHEAIDAYFETGLPDLIDLDKELCAKDMNLKTRLELIKSYMCACNELIERFGLLCIYGARLETKFQGMGIKIKPTYDLTGMIACYILYIEIPKIGICSFDVANRFMLFSMEPHIPRSVFGIYDKPEDKDKWNKVRNSVVPNLYYTMIGDFQIHTKDMIYETIEKAIENAVGHKLSME
jgi:hypothetical protein